MSQHLFGRSVLRVVSVCMLLHEAECAGAESGGVAVDVEFPVQGHVSWQSHEALMLPCAASSLRRRPDCCNSASAATSCGANLWVLCARLPVVLLLACARSCTLQRGKVPRGLL